MSQILQPEQIRALALAQRQLRVILTLTVLFAVGNAAFNSSSFLWNRSDVTAVGIGILIVFLSLAFAQIYATISICRAMDDGWLAICYALPMLIPCTGVAILLLVVLNRRATIQLQRAGIRVGLFGADRSDVSNYRPLELGPTCLKCGLDLDPGTTNCSQCGRAL